MVGAVIVAAGESRRMDGIDKVFALLGGQPVLLRVLAPFQKSARVDRIVVVASRENVEKCRQILTGNEWNKVRKVCPGGARRQDSVRAGLNELRDCEWVIIQDAARPLVTQELIESGLEAARETGAAIAAVPVKDTIKTAGEDHIVQTTPDRSNLWAAQTPQVFRFDIIDRAYREIDTEVTDDASLVEQAGYKVKIYPGSYRNLKITTRDDLACAEALLKYEH